MKDRAIPQQYIDLLNQCESDIIHIKTGSSLYNKGLQLGAGLMRFQIEEAITLRKVYLPGDGKLFRFWRPSLRFFLSSLVSSMKITNVSIGESGRSGLQEGYIFFGEKLMDLLGMES